MKTIFTKSIFRAGETASGDPALAADLIDGRSVVLVLSPRGWVEARVVQSETLDRRFSVAVPTFLFGSVLCEPDVDALRHACALVLACVAVEAGELSSGTIAEALASNKWSRS